jgi:hypothetical protein
VSESPSGPQAAAFQQRLDSLGNKGRNADNIGVFRWGQLVEFRLAVLVCSVNSVDDQAVKVWREIQRIAAALHERHGPALRQLQPQEFPGAAAKFAKDDSDENIQDIAQQTGVVGQAVAQRKWNRKHPLPDRDNREDVVDEMRGRLRHSSSSTRRAPTATTAGKRNQALVPARTAANTYEAAGR